MERITSRINSRMPRILYVKDSVRAAVLIPIWQQEDGLCFILTQRTEQVETHKGQISFPGGMCEPVDESLIQTALRETHEEIGLHESQINILGQFDEYLSGANLIVTPFIGWGEPPLVLKRNPEEVEKILEVPWKLFRNPRQLKTESRHRFGRDVTIYHYDFYGLDIWGLTAQIIRDFLKLIDSSC